MPRRTHFFVDYFCQMRASAHVHSTPIGPKYHAVSDALKIISLGLENKEPVYNLNVYNFAYATQKLKLIF